MHSVTSNAVAEALGEWVTVWSSATSNIKGIETKTGKYLCFNFDEPYNVNMGEGELLLTITDNKWKPTTITRFPVQAVVSGSSRTYCNVDYATDGTLKFYPSSVGVSMYITRLYSNTIIKIA